MAKKNEIARNVYIHDLADMISDDINMPIKDIIKIISAKLDEFEIHVFKGIKQNY